MSSTSGERLGRSAAGYTDHMSDTPDGVKPPQVPSAPALPDVDSPPPEDVLDGAPSVGDIIGKARRSEEIIEEQPSRDDLVGGDS